MKILYMTLLILLCSSFVQAKEIHKEEVNIYPSIYVLVTYEVEAGDTLDSIAKTYMKKNTYAPRDIKEFRQGIIELNPWLLDRNMKPGDRLEIRYWRKPS